MLLRHITNINSLESIIKDGCLDSKYNKRKHDRDYLSFELNPKTNFLVDIFHLLKEWDPEETFELLFDGEKLLENHYEIHDSMDNIKFNKQIDVGWKLKGKVSFSENDIEMIGDYCFIKGKVSLEYLTKETKEKILKVTENS
ncbi:hypothetical protein SOP93_17050 [Peribacillus frigoritolerans]|uniref:hypothetical protein n=1 Tax=Peribacillus frigoritolerans TaxID=450367 RepID=UPI002B243875|nr:hypothetical protein [Peribacillus frigoritolerans]MEB2492874.1 hypothetical protein [Peribacillus frigoritolerans]